MKQQTQSGPEHHQPKVEAAVPQPELAGLLSLQAIGAMPGLLHNLPHTNNNQLLRQASLRQLQKTHGNQYVQRLLLAHPAPAAAPIIQRKAPISPDAGPGGTSAPTPGATPTPQTNGQAPEPTGSAATSDNKAPVGGAAAPTPTPGPTPTNPTAPTTDSADSPANDAANDKLRRDSFSGDYTNANSYENKLDAKIAELFEQRADPKSKETLNKMIGSADSARLDSLQYSFNSGKFSSQLFNMLVPGDAFVEHFRQATTNNAYASSASMGSWSGRIAGLQTGIEFFRGIYRMIADVVGAAGTVLGAIAVASGGLALIPPLAPAMGPLAAASAAAGEILTIAKAGMDIFDIQVGLLQTVLNIVRARLSDDPKDRARIAQLIKKEAGDMSGNFINVFIQVGSIGLGKGLGKLAGKGVADEVSAVTRMGVKEFFSQFRKSTMSTWRLEYNQAVKIAQNDAKALARMGFGVPARQLAFEARLRNPKFSLVAARFSSAAWPSAKLMNARLQAVNSAGLAVSIGTNLAGNQTKIAAANDSDAGPFTANGGPGSGGPTPANGSSPKPGEANEEPPFAHVAYWPSILEEMGSTREDIHSAQERMEDQHRSAKEDAGDKAKAVSLAYGGISKTGNRIKAAGAQMVSPAVASQNESDKLSAAAKKAKEQEAKSKNQGKQTSDKAEDAKGKVDQAQETTKSASANQQGEKSWLAQQWDKAKQWLWDKTLGKIFAALGAAQQWINKQVLKYALKAAGLNEADLDLAGIDSAALGEKEAGQKAETDAKETEAKGAEIDKTAEQLKEGATDAEKNAIQGMIDTLAWIRLLDSWDQGLAEEQDIGAKYIDQAQLALKTEMGADKKPEGSRIEAADVAPLHDHGKLLQAEIKGAPGNLRTVGQQHVTTLRTRLEQHYGYDASIVVPAGHAALNGLIEKAQTSFNGMNGQATSLVNEADNLVGGINFNRLTAIFQAFEQLVANFYAVQTQVIENLDKILQGYADAFAAAIQENMTNESPNSPEQPGSEK